MIKKNKNIPNRWEDLTPETFEYLFPLLMQIAGRQLAPAMVKILFVCRVPGINGEKTDSATFETVKTLAAQVTFPISVVYPNYSGVLSELPLELREAARKIPPERLPPSAMTKYLRRLDYRFVIDDRFCAQLIPFIKVAGEIRKACEINTRFDSLTCNLTALQYIEARQLTGRPKDTLPLMAAILYHPELKL
jgi:hypothetical protein